LICGTLLHDLGKVWEYSFVGTFDLSEDGRLIGHIPRAVMVIEKNALRLGTMPENILQQLLHLVLSHHGTQEWGSPVIPKTLEAVLLHQIDLIDSRVQGFFEHLLADVSGGDWTTKFSPMHQTQLRRPESWQA
jgi:3'-5' exoribonuclease